MHFRAGKRTKCSKRKTGDSAESGPRAGERHKTLGKESHLGPSGGKDVMDLGGGGFWWMREDERLDMSVQVNSKKWCLSSLKPPLPRKEE